MEKTEPEPRAKGPAVTLARMPTGAKVFLILLGCLLPLALIALFVTIQTARTADNETRERVRAVAEESSAIVEGTLANQVGQQLNNQGQARSDAALLRGAYTAQGLNGLSSGIKDIYSQIFPKGINLGGGITL